MKQVKIASISLGSSKRDFTAKVELAGVCFSIKRLGTNGNVLTAAKLLQQVDDRVDAIGIGGVNLAYRCGTRTYPLKEGRYLAGCARRNVVVDGSFVKEHWEPELIRRLAQVGKLEVKGKRVLITSVLDRYYLAACLRDMGAKVWVGDALLALKLPVLFPSVATFSFAAAASMPILRHVPLRYLYPLGRQQEVRQRGLPWLLKPMQIIAGDFHLINRYLPQNLQEKILLTSTLTASDCSELSQRGATKVMALGLTVGARALGANVLEAMICGAAKTKVFGTAEWRCITEIFMTEVLRQGMLGDVAKLVHS